MLALLLFIAVQQAPPAPVENQLKLKQDVEQALNQFVLETRRWSGTIDVFDVTGEKKLVRNSIVKSDGQRYLVQILDASKKPTNIELFRPFGDTRQSIALAGRNGTLNVTKDEFRKKGEPAFPFEDHRFFASQSPVAIPLRAVPTLNYSVLDFLQSPACRISKIEPLTLGQQKIVKVTYTISKEENDKLAAEQKLNQVMEGWVELRPDQLWTVHRAEFKVAGARRAPARTWKADYVYDTTPREPASKAPVIKEIRMETIDQAPAAGTTPELKLVKQLFAFGLQPVSPAWKDTDFSMAQFGVKEHTANDWLAEMAAKEKAEAEEQAKIAALPPGAIKMAAAKDNIDPWIVLIGGVAALIFLVMWVFWVTSKPDRPTKPIGQ
jgi:hypothetical protein